MLVELTHPQGIMIRTERGVSRAEGIELRDGPYWGKTPDGPLLIVDHGLTYELDLAEGQKTGFYLDQRENRVAAARYFRDRRVLDMFCYSGGFAMAASAIGGAREVLGIDTSQRAVTLAWANAQRNGIEERPLPVRRRVPDARSRWWRPASGSAAWCSIRPSSPAAAAPWPKRCGPTTG